MSLHEYPSVVRIVKQHCLRQLQKQRGFQAIRCPMCEQRSTTLLSERGAASAGFRVYRDRTLLVVVYRVSQECQSFHGWLRPQAANPLPTTASTGNC